LTQEIAYRFLSCNGDSKNDEHCTKREEYRRAPQTRLSQFEPGSSARAYIACKLAMAFAQISGR